MLSAFMSLLVNGTAIFILILTILMLVTATINLFYRVPYVPSKMRVVKKMVEVAKLKKGDIVYDLGCGDGRLLLEAEKNKEVETRGYEAAPIPFLLAHLKKLFHHSRMKIYPSNFIKANLSDANVIFCYLGPETMTELSNKLKKECRKGT